MRSHPHLGFQSESESESTLSRLMRIKHVESNMPCLFFFYRCISDPNKWKEVLQAGLSQIMSFCCCFRFAESLVVWKRYKSSRKEAESSHLSACSALICLKQVNAAAFEPNNLNTARSKNSGFQNWIRSDGRGRGTFPPDPTTRWENRHFGGKWLANWGHDLLSRRNE